MKDASVALLWDLLALPAVSAQERVEKWWILGIDRLSLYITHR